MTILHQVKDLQGPIGPGVTLTCSTGEKDLHMKLSGAGIVGKRVIVMTIIAPCAVVLKIK